MRYLCARILVLILILFEMDKDKVEKASVAAIEKYLLPCSLIKSFINTNDKTPFWDGDLFVYKKDDQKGNVKDNFHGRVPIQVKGRSDNTTYFKISNAEAKAFYNDGGCLFFKVLVKDDFSSTILYSLLSRKVIKEHLQQNDGDIKFQLEEVPNNPLDFQQKVYDFVTLRNGENAEKSSPKEIEDLVEEFEKMRGYLGEIKDNDVKIELELYLDSIKNLKADATIGWRDKFILYSRKALDLASKNINDYDFTGLQFKFGVYLFNQKQYHLVEDFFSKILKELRNRGDAINLAKTLNNLAVLHYKLTYFEQAEIEYKEALRILCELVKKNPNAYLPDAARTINNLGNLHRKLTRYEAAKEEFNVALVNYRELAKKNPNVFNEYVAMMLNNLAELDATLNKYEAAEKEWKEALEIYKELAKKNHETYIANVAMTLNNLAGLYKDIGRNAEAELECQESLGIYRELSKNNPEVYISDVAMTLNNLGELHRILSNYKAAEEEYQEALEIRRELAKTNRDAYIDDVATTLNNMAILHKDLTNYEAAEEEYKRALGIRRDQAKKYPDAYNEHVATTLNNLAALYFILDRYEDAEQKYQEALVIRRKLAETNRDAYIEHVAETLFNIALLRLKDEIRLDEARDAANEALKIYKELAINYPRIWNSYVEKTQRLLDYINLSS